MTHGSVENDFWIVERYELRMDVPDRKLGLMLRIHGLFQLLTNEIRIGVITH